IPLPNAYVVPGGRFREVYYWDSYFTMLGLVAHARTDLVRSMLDNFAVLVRTVGHVPNGNRTYYLSRSQPPYLAAMVGLYAAATGAARLGAPRRRARPRGARPARPGGAAGRGPGSRRPAGARAGGEDVGARGRPPAARRRPRPGRRAPRA